MRISYRSKAMWGAVLLAGLGMAGTVAQAQTQTQYKTANAAPQGFDPRNEAGERVYESNNTITQIVRLEEGGSQMRLYFDNENSTDPDGVIATSISVTAYYFKNSQLMSETKPVNFQFTGKGLYMAGGQTNVYSDVISFDSVKNFSRGDKIAVTFFYATKSHGVNYVKDTYAATTTAPDTSANTVVPVFTKGAQYRRSPLQRVELIPTTAKNVLVAIGDSITAGYLSTDFANKSYPEQLTNLYSDGNHPGGDQWSVVNTGIAGNRIVSEAAREDFASPGLVTAPRGKATRTRFERDALDVTGVTAVLLLEGINDIFTPPTTADDIKTGIATAISKAHKAGKRIYVGTILPAANISTPAEAIRVNVNQWIRANTGGSDGCIEFANALRDGTASPAVPKAMYFSKTDKGEVDLHPNDAGYGVMAAQVSLATINGQAPSKTCPVTKDN